MGLRLFQTTTIGILAGWTLAFSSSANGSDHNFEYCGPHVNAEMPEWPPRLNCRHLRYRTQAEQIQCLANHKPNPFRCYLMYRNTTPDFARCLQQQRSLVPELSSVAAETVTQSRLPSNVIIRGVEPNCPSSQLPAPTQKSIGWLGQILGHRQQPDRTIANALGGRYSETALGLQSVMYGFEVHDNLGWEAPINQAGRLRSDNLAGWCLEGFEQTFDRSLRMSLLGTPYYSQPGDRPEDIREQSAADFAVRVGGVSVERSEAYLRQVVARFDGGQTSAHQLASNRRLEEWGFQNLIRPPAASVAAGLTYNPNAGKVIPGSCRWVKGRRRCSHYAEQGVNCAQTPEERARVREVIARAPAGAILVYTGGNHGHGHVETVSANRRFCSDGCVNDPTVARCLVGIYVPKREVGATCNGQR